MTSANVSYFDDVKSQKKRAFPYGIKSKSVFDNIKATQGFNKSMGSYDVSRDTLMTSTNNYINTTSSPNRYSNKIIRLSNKQLGFVTNRNVFKHIGSNDILDTIKNNGCPMVIEDVDFSSEKYLSVGEYLGTAPNFIVGKPMEKNSTCLTTGTNIEVNGYSDYKDLTHDWVGCYNQTGDFFDKQPDLTSNYKTNTIKQCAIRTADVGSSTFYIGSEPDNKHSCFTSKVGLKTDFIKSKMEPGIIKKVSSVIHSGVMDKYANPAMGLMNNKQIALGSLSTDTSIIGENVNFGKNVENPYMWANKGTSCDPVYGAKVDVKSATYGSNISSVAKDNWLDAVKAAISTSEESEKLNFNITANPDPAPGFKKSFSALYSCSPSEVVKSLYVRGEAAGKSAKFNCNDEYRECMKGKLVLTNLGNLELYTYVRRYTRRYRRGRMRWVISWIKTRVWESKTSVVGIPLEENKAINSKYGRNHLNVGDFLYPGEFIGSNSGNCILVCDKNENANECTLSIVYYLNGCHMKDEVPSITPGKSGSITNEDNIRPTYSINNIQDNSLNGKVFYINDNMEKMEYPESMLGLSNEYNDIGPYEQSTKNIKTISNSDLDECKLECSAIDNCYGFIHKTDKTCELKDKPDIFPSNLQRILSNDARMFIRKSKINNPNSCSGSFSNSSIPIDTIRKIPKGEDMTPNTSCMLGKATEYEVKNVANEKNTLTKATSIVSNSMTMLNKDNNRLDRQIKRTDKRLKHESKSYKSVLHNTEKSITDMDNITAMGTEIEKENVRQNLNYMIWTSVASIAVITIIKTSN